MGKFFEKIGCTAILVMYVLAYAGFGIHYCKCGHETGVVVMTGGYSSESVHKHVHGECHCHTSESCHGHCNGVYLHDASCHTFVYAVTASQESDSDFKNSTPDVHFIDWVPSAYGQASACCFGQIRQNHAVPDTDFLKMFSVWRI